MSDAPDTLTPEQVAARAKYLKNVRPCAGTCGRSTRSTKVPKHLFPETACRRDGQYCTSCWRDVQDQKLIAAGKPVPTRGPGGRKELSEARLEDVAREIEKFTAGRRARLAQKERLANGQQGRPPGMGGHRVAALRPARNYNPPGAEQKRTG